MWPKERPEMAGTGSEPKRSRRISSRLKLGPLTPQSLQAAEDDAGGFVEEAAEGEGGEHAVDAVGLFVDVLEEDDRAGRVGLVGGAHERGDHGEVAADEGAASNEAYLCTGMQDRAGPNTNLLSSVRRLG
jgi:hypothetical protein